MRRSSPSETTSRGINQSTAQLQQFKGLSSSPRSQRQNAMSRSTYAHTNNVRDDRVTGNLPDYLIMKGSVYAPPHARSVVSARRRYWGRFGGPPATPQPNPGPRSSSNQGTRARKSGSERIIADSTFHDADSTFHDDERFVKADERFVKDLMVLLLKAKAFDYNPAGDPTAVLSYNLEYEDEHPRHVIIHRYHRKRSPGFNVTMLYEATAKDSKKKPKQKKYFNSRGRITTRQQLRLEWTNNEFTRAIFKYKDDAGQRDFALIEKLKKAIQETAMELK